MHRRGEPRVRPVDDCRRGTLCGCPDLGPSRPSGFCYGWRKACRIVSGKL